RIDEELRRIEAVAGARVVRSVGAQSVTASRFDFSDEGVEDVAGALRQRNALLLGLSGRVEEAELDRRGVRGKYRDVDAAGNERHPERFRIAAIGATHEFSA